MKLFFAIKSLDHAHGGAEKVLVEVVGALKRAGHEVSVLTFDAPGGKSFYPLEQDVRRMCLRIGDPARKSGVSDTLKRMRTLRRTIRDERPDAVIAFMHSMFIPLSLAMAGSGIPLIDSEYIVPEHYRTRRLEFLLLCVSALFVRRMTVISEAVRSLYPGFLRRRMSVIPNPVYRAADPHQTEHEPLQKKGDSARSLILSVGRLDPQKDQACLIRAFAGLAPDYPNWDVKIIGEGALRGDLEALIKEKGLERRITLPGLTQDIHAEYAAADLFVLPSRYESFGLATAEALAHGVPAIGFADCPGTNEIIQDGTTGRLVPGGSDEERARSLAAGMKELMDHPDQRTAYGMAGRESVAAYSLEHVSERWESLLADVIG